MQSKRFSGVKTMTEVDRKTYEAMTKQLADDGKIIEAGWMSLRMLAIAPNAPEIQVREMRMAFMAGAQHLFSSIMNMLDPGFEDTDNDIRRMDLIHEELIAFGEELERRLDRDNV
jgi:hypothetical protein